MVISSGLGPSIRARVLSTFVEGGGGGGGRGRGGGWWFFIIYMGGGGGGKSCLPPLPIAMDTCPFIPPSFFFSIHQALYANVW